MSDPEKGARPDRLSLAKRPAQLYASDVGADAPIIDLEAQRVQGDLTYKPRKTGHD